MNTSEDRGKERLNAICSLLFAANMTQNPPPAHKGQAALKAIPPQRSSGSPSEEDVSADEAAAAPPPRDDAFTTWLRELWKEVPTLITVAGLFSYVVGRIAVDGFYGQLHTTAEAAGIGYISILEPAAIVTAAAAFICFLIFLIVNILPLNSSHKNTLSLIIFSVLSASSGGTLFLTNLLPVDIIDALATALPVSAIPALGWLVHSIRSIREPNTGPPVERSPVNPESTGSGMFDRLSPKPISVLVCLILGASLYSAHVFGTDNGRQAASGKPTQATYLGFVIPSMSASAVHVQPIASSAAFKQLIVQKCWLEIGPGGSSLLLYDPLTRVSLTVSADQVIVTSTAQSCIPTMAPNNVSGSRIPRSSSLASHRQSHR